MKVKILSLGKVRQDFVKKGEEEYLQRLRSWIQLDIRELPNERFSGLPENVLKEKEGALLLQNVSPTDFLVVLDEHGENLDSQGFSQFFEQRRQNAQNHLVFAIGGAFGWDEAVVKKASYTLSLSKLTFPYQLTRLILVEQLYRALTIIKRIPYHK